MQRITEKDLERLVTIINKATKSPETTYTKLKNGKYKANIGNYYISYAYGGAQLERIVNIGGGCENVLHSGFTSKRNLYNLLHAYLLGCTNKR